MRRGGVGVAVLLVGAVGAGWVVYEKLDSNITADNDAADELARYEKERPTALVRDAQNILLIGSDSRSGDGNSAYGRDSGTERSDTTILLHLAADRKSATAVSIPRDLMVNVPSCRRPDGTRTAPRFAMFNSAFQVGGSACTIRTVEKLTDIRVDHHIVVDFRGFKEMVDAVDGVEVCLTEPMNDPAAKLTLAAGKHTLNGEQALGYVRARKSLGNGSDTGRIDRQQRFLAALVNKVHSNDVLLNPTKLYPLLDAATSSLTTDPDLASLRGLYQLVRGVRHIPMERVQFLTVPRRAYVHDPNRDQLVEPDAQRLFTRLRLDEPVAVAKDGSDTGSTAPSNEPSGQGSRTSGDGSHTTPDGSPAERTERPAGTATDTAQSSRSASPPPDPVPTFRGNTAAEDGCG